MSKSKRKSTWVLSERAGYLGSLHIAYQYYISLNTPRALSCYLLLRNNEIDQLVSMQCIPSEYLSWREYYLDALAIAFLKKFKFRRKYHPGYVPRTKQRATETFLQMEQHCRETNDRIFLNRLSGDAREVIYHAREKISKILIDFSTEEWIDSCRFGPGADLNHKVSRSTVFDKMVGKLTSTVAFHPLATALVKSHPSWAPHVEVEPVWHNRVAFVPKDAKTDRVIAIEPGLNAYAQAGIGRMIRRRLSLFGNSIKYQHVNQKHAEIGSVSGDRATIDLSSASDTLSVWLVRMLIPEPWLTACELLRAPFGKLKDKETVCYEKFSSMGNGYTFELETLIFWVLAQTVTKIKGASGPVRAYGDDIIVPACVAEDLASVFNELGFIVNLKKSYYTGPFRESCGMDYFSGMKVRPLYLKEPLSNVPSIYKLANGISRAAYFLHGVSSGRDARLEKCWKQVVRLLPKEARAYFGPFQFDENGMGIPAVTDAWLSVDFDVALPSGALHRHRGRKCGWEGWEIQCFRARSRKFSFNERDGDLAVAMYLSRNGSEVSTEGSLDLRGRVSYYTCRETVHQWGDLGPWA